MLEMCVIENFVKFALSLNKGDTIITQSGIKKERFEKVVMPEGFAFKSLISLTLLNSLFI